MTYSTIAVIYNPNSTGSSKDLAAQFEQALRTKLPDQKIELIATEHANHAEELAYSIAKENEHALIISSSGDGGYNEVVNGAMKAQQEGVTVTTGLLPAGNANDHYHNLHDDDFVQSVINENAKKIDLLKLTSIVDGKPFERYAHSYIGFGLTPKVGKELNKTKLSLGKEVVLVARVLLTVKATSLRIEGKRRHYDSIIFSNIDKMSKYLTISSPSSTTDGKFEVTIFKRRNRLKLIAVLLKASLSGVKENYRVTEFSLTTIKRTLVQLDGEIATLDARSEVKITAEEQVLSCIV